MLHEKLTSDIIGAAMTVHNTLRPGFDEKYYEKALVLELQLMGHQVAHQKSFEVRYRGHLLGDLQPDMIVDGLVVVDTKVVTAFNESHVLQMLGYLNVTKLDLALLINFAESRLRWKRVIASRSMRENNISGFDTE